MPIIPRTRRGGRRGAALVELAVVTPILFTMLLGIIEFGRAFMVVEIVTNGSREGARIAAAQGAGTVANVKTQTAAYLQAAGIGDGTYGANKAITAITVSEVSGGTATALADTVNLDDTSSGATVQSGDAIQVYVEVDFSKVSWLPNGLFMGSGKRVPGTTVMRRE